jgi:hypothetical protein
MSRLIRHVTTRWVPLIQRYAPVALWVALLCSLTAAYSGLRLFALDLGLDNLIRPNADSTSHAPHKTYEAAFPQFQDVAIVVLSGDNPHEVDAATDTLLATFQQSGRYVQAEAPGRDPFWGEHRLYQSSTAQLTRLAAQLQELLPTLRQLDADPGLAGVLDLLRQMLLLDEANLGRSEATRELLTTVYRALVNPGQPVDWLHGMTLAEDHAGYQLILLQGEQRFGETTPSTRVINATRSTIAEFARAHPRVAVRLTGDLVTADEELQITLLGIRVAVGLSLLLLGLVWAAGVRSRALTPLCVFTTSVLLLSLLPMDYRGQTTHHKTLATLVELQREGITSYSAISMLAPVEQVPELTRQLAALPEVASVISPVASIPADQHKKSTLLAPLAGFSRLTLATPIPWDYSAADKARQQLLATLPAATNVYDLEDAALLSAIASSLAALDNEASLRTLQDDLLDELYRQMRTLQKQVLAKPFTLADLPPATRARIIAADGRHLISAIPAQHLDSREAIDQFVLAVKAVAPDAIVVQAVFEPSGQQSR